MLGPDGLPRARGPEDRDAHDGEDVDPDDALAAATTQALARRLMRLAELEATAARDGTDPAAPPWLHPQALDAWALYGAATDAPWGRCVALAFAAARTRDPTALAEGWSDWALRAEDPGLDAALEAALRGLAALAERGTELSPGRAVDASGGARPSPLARPDDIARQRQGRRASRRP